MLLHLDDLGPACGLQVRERRVQDLSLRGEGRHPLQVSPVLQAVPGHDPEDEALVAEAVGHCCLDVVCMRSCAECNPAVHKRSCPLGP